MQVTPDGIKVVTRAPELLHDLEEISKGVADWKPEFGKWMLEGTPAMPYGGYTSDLLMVESNMRQRSVAVPPLPLFHYKHKTTLRPNHTMKCDAMRGRIMQARARTIGLA